MLLAICRRVMLAQGLSRNLKAKKACPLSRDRKRAVLLSVESLERRINPTDFTWTGAADGLRWNNAGNWNPEGVPSSNAKRADTVRIEIGAPLLQGVLASDLSIL